MILQLFYPWLDGRSDDRQRFCFTLKPKNRASQWFRMYLEVCASISIQRMWSQWEPFHSSFFDRKIQQTRFETYDFLKKKKNWRSATQHVDLRG